MELKKISESARYSATVEEFNVKATIVKDESGSVKIEQGTVHGPDSGYLAGFSSNGQSLSFNFNTANRSQRTALVPVIEDFVEQLTNTMK